MEKLQIPFWLLALAFLAICGLFIYSIATERPIYIHGQPWGSSKQVTSVDVHALEQRLIALEKEPKYGGSYQVVDPGFPTGNQYYNPLTRGLSCPSEYRPVHVGRVRTAEPEAGANQYVCIKP